LYSYRHPSHLHAFPTRRSSDLAQTKMPRMNFRERTLPNGMRVLSVIDKSSPTVAINVWYHVGSKDDPDHRSGFAHLFEHIMFKRSEEHTLNSSHQIISYAVFCL